MTEPYGIVRAVGEHIGEAVTAVRSRDEAATVKAHTRTHVVPARNVRSQAFKAKARVPARAEPDVLRLGKVRATENICTYHAHLVLAHQGPHHRQENVHRYGGKGWRKRPCSDRVDHLAPVSHVWRNLVASQPGEAVVGDDALLPAGTVTAFRPYMYI